MDQDKLCDVFQRMQVDCPDTSNATHALPRPRNGFKDITREFLEASESLVIGQLVQDPEFTLLEAVGALELMDPKMDSGLIQSTEADAFDVVAPRLPEEVIGVIDQLICCEMAWHNGSALSQTVFTSLHVDRLLSTHPRSLEEATFQEHSLPGEPEKNIILQEALRAYCLGTIKCCNCVNTQVLREASYEDEDFVTQTYNISLLDSISVEEVLDCLDASLGRLQGLERSTSREALDGLVNRIAQRMAFLRAVAKPIPLYYETGATEWEDLLALTSSIEESHSLGKPVPAAFSTCVQRKLASTVPPRPKIELSFQEATANVKRMCKEMKDMVKIADYESPPNIINFMVYFNARKPSPSTYIRTVLQSLLLRDSLVVGKVSIKDFILQDLQELVNPKKILLDPANELAEVPNSPRYEIAKRVSRFVEAGGNLLIDLIQKQCMNRSRLRRQLCHTIVDWDRFQAQAEELDAELLEITHEQPLVNPNNGNTPSYAYPLSSWAFYYKLLQIEWIILLGFELDIYQPYEYAGMYWVAQDYIRTRIRHLERIHFHASNAPPDRVEKTRHTLSYLTGLILQASATQDLVGGLLHTYSALLSTSLISTPLQPFSTPELRYELRMKPLAQITSPEVPPWEFVPSEYFDPRATYSSLEPPQILAEADASLREAKAFISEAKRQFELISKIKPKLGRFALCEDMWRENVRELLRSCIGASVALVGIGKMLEVGKEDRKRWRWKIESGNKRYHEWFGVVSVTEEKKREGHEKRKER